ncbi:hypothetical protein LZ31DRAFT_215940 [Colletotrichum somersetense]|nr:hypothetical protein LZ31DRAFT_215940 [Colletotrichum somersetense]
MPTRRKESKKKKKTSDFRSPSPLSHEHHPSSIPAPAKYTASRKVEGRKLTVSPDALLWYSPPNPPLASLFPAVIYMQPRRLLANDVAVPRPTLRSLRPPPLVAMIGPASLTWPHPPPASNHFRPRTGEWARVERG